MRITRIETQKKRPGRKTIFADGKFIAGVSDETLLRLGLRTGDDLSPETVKALQRTEELWSARNAALRLISYRPRTERELRDRLREKEYPDTDIVATIEDLKRSGLVNDAEFARTYLRDALALRPKGKLALKRKLLLLGLDKSIVEESLQEVFSEVNQEDAALEAARRFLRKSGGKKRTEDPAAIRNRLANYLARQGYGWDTIRPVLRTALDIRTDEDE